VLTRLVEESVSLSDFNDEIQESFQIPGKYTCR
jgi:hypothetical protein